MFIRFVVNERDEQSDQPRGVFSAVYRLERAGQLQPHEVDWLRTVDEWFDTHLKRPERLNWSTRPGARDRAITWLKTSATEHVSRMRGLIDLLSHKDVVVKELLTDKPGYVVYEDEHQVAAIPFGETP